MIIELLFNISSTGKNSYFLDVSTSKSNTILWLKNEMVRKQYNGLSNVLQIKGLKCQGKVLSDQQRLHKLQRYNKDIVAINVETESDPLNDWSWTHRKHSPSSSASPIKRVLCIDAGGVRGLAAIRFLAHLEEKLGEPLHQFFDLFAGTSTGCLICLCIGAKGSTAKELEELYTPPNFARFMPQTWKEKHIPFLLPRPKYDAKLKTQVNREIFGDLEFQDCKKHVMAVAYNITEQEAWIFTNKSKGVLVADAVDASSAAPGFFAPKNIGDHWFIDGTVVARDPTLCAYAEARNLYGDDADIRILSIGTGLPIRQLDGKETENYGSIDWLARGGIFEIFSNNTIIQKQAEMFLGEGKYCRVNSHLIMDCYIDDYSEEHLESLRQLGSLWFQEKQDTVLSVLLGRPQKAKFRHSLSYPLNITRKSGPNTTPSNKLFENKFKISLFVVLVTLVVLLSYYYTFK